VIESKVICPACGKIIQSRYSTYWECGSCGRKYKCTQGVPKLYLEERLGKADRTLRDRLYNASLGRAYNLIMPWLSLPARPISSSSKYWLIYVLMVLALVFLIYHCTEWIVVRRFHATTFIDMLLAFVFITYAFFLAKHTYIAFNLLLAVPTKISLLLHPFKPVSNFTQIHAEFQKEYLGQLTSYAFLMSLLEAVIRFSDTGG
jgi:hypothetical protein